MQRIERSCCNSVPLKNIPRGTITSVVDCSRNQGSVENIPRKRKQPNLEDRDTRKLLRSVKENRKRSLSDVTVLLNQNREVVKLIVKPDFPCVEVTDTKLFTDGFKVDIGSDVRIFIWRKVGEDWTPCCLAQTQRQTSV